MATGTETLNRSEPSGNEPPPASPPGAVVIAVGSGESGGDKKAGGAYQEEGKAETCGGGVVIDVNPAGGGDGERNGEAEKVCRICHVNPELGELEGSGLIHLGCGCKGELGTAHRHCAETWFRVKGNRCCEICGVNAKNVIGKEDSSFMEAWHERRMLNIRGNRNLSERSSCWRSQPFCNFLMTCLIIAFILPWFLRLNVF